MNEQFVHELDFKEEVKALGYSTVLRQAAFEYLARRRKRAFDAACAKA